MGTVALAVTTIVIQIQSVSYMQMIAVSHASTTLVGQYIGAGLPEVARKSGHSALRIGALYGILVAVIFVWWRGSLVGLFNDDPLVLELGAVVILYSAAMQLLDAPGIAVTGTLRGAGDTRFIFLAGAVASWGVLLPLAYALGTLAGLGIEGAWFGMVAWATVLSLLIVSRFLRGRWLELRI